MAWLMRVSVGFLIVVMTVLSPLKAQSRIEVVASFSILADLTQAIGGERLSVTSLVPREADAHVFQPAPQDAKRIAAARAVIINGLGFEGWMERLIKAAGGKAMVITASQAIKPLKSQDAHGHGLDPHAWHDVANAKAYVIAIRDGLSRIDPEGKNDYESRSAELIRALDQLDADIRQSLADIPPARRVVVTSHDAFGYFARAYGIRLLAPQGVSTETEASAKDIARVIKQIRAEKIPAVILENVSDPRLLDQISRETGAKLGGKLYSDALSLETGPASTYIALMRHNSKVFREAMMP
jgi:zinc/manganese transport system substrate-binding protein